MLIRNILGVRCRDVASAALAQGAEGAAARSSGRPPLVSCHTGPLAACRSGAATDLYALSGCGGAWVSVQTIDRRVVPAIDTVKTVWGSRLIPVSELERYLAEHTEPARSLQGKATSRGRPAAVPEEVASRIEQEYGLGKSLGQIARDLNAAGVPTAQGGRKWWPSTVRSILLRRSL